MGVFKGILVAAVIVATVVVAVMVGLWYWKPLELKDPPPDLPGIEEVEPVAPTAGVKIDFLQLSSHRTLAEAAKAVTDHYLRYPTVAPRGSLLVYEVDLPTGRWYRVVRPYGSRVDAEVGCVEVKRAGGDCIVVSFPA